MARHVYQKAVKSRGLDELVDLMAELGNFIRARVCLAMVGIAAFGYLMFSSSSITDPTLVFVALAAFFLAGATYAYNQMADKAEDAANRRLNKFVLWPRAGYATVVILAAVGLTLLLFLPPPAIIFGLLVGAVGAVYSFFRLKQAYPLKNILTAAGLGLIFLFGVAGAKTNLYELFSTQVLASYLLIAFFLAILSLLGDLRDLKGDLAAGVKTVPVALSANASKRLVAVLLFLFAAFVILAIVLGLSQFFAFLLPFLIPMAFFLRKNDFLTAHSLGVSAFIVLLPVFVVLKIFGG